MDKRTLEDLLRDLDLPDHSVPKAAGVVWNPYRKVLAVQDIDRHARLYATIDKMCDTWAEGFTRKPKSKMPLFRQCVEDILVNALYVHPRAVALPTGAGTLTRLSRYMAEHQTKVLFQTAIETLENADVLQRQTKAHHVRRGRTGFNLYPTFKLADHAVISLQAEQYTHAEFYLAPMSEVIHLKDTDKRLIAYTDSDAIRRMRSNVIDINKAMASTNIGLPEEYTDPDSRNQMYRVFNNADWQQGGRFYGTHWHNLNKSVRAQITLDGDAVVERDFSAMHPRILLAQLSSSGDEMMSDPYMRLPEAENSKTARDMHKIAFNALLNSKTSRVSEPMGYNPDEIGMEWASFLDKVHAVWPELNGVLGTGEGLRLQSIDAAIAENVHLYFAKEGVPCLSVHDSFIVPEARQDELDEAMTTLHQTITGVVPVID